MPFRIEIVDPLSAAAPASRVLRSAWKPPCLDYSPAYLAWQFDFPGLLQPTVAIAYLDSQPVGCAAVTQRAFVSEGSRLDAYVLSFVGVDPIARGRGLAAAVYARLLDALAPDVPVIAFAEPGSTGERLLINAFAQASFEHHSLKPCCAVGFLNRPGARDETSASAIAATNYEEFAIVRPSGDTDTAWISPTAEQWKHYMADPRQRTAIVIRDRSGAPMGSGMIVMSEVLSLQGLQRVPMLEGMYLTSGDPNGLRAAFRFAAVQGEPSATIIASNLSCIDGAVIKAAGARALPSAFNAYIFFKKPQRRFASLSRLNLEVI